MAQLGADVEQLDRLARTFDTEATRLERSASTLRSLVASVTWMGPDAGQFRGQFNQAMSQQLVAAARALHEEARHLSLQATQQRVASDDGSGVGGGAGGGGGGGGGRIVGWRWDRERRVAVRRRGFDVQRRSGRRRRGVRRRRSAGRGLRGVRRPVLHPGVGQRPGRGRRRGLGRLHDG